jgi:branched-subunit amino acid aminotransferase/4-amino-4-deoxychorismate lyase
VVLELAAGDGMKVVERNVSLAEVYTADEVFTTGTMGELAPVVEVDGRAIADGGLGPITKRLQELHRQRTRGDGELLPRAAG